MKAGICARASQWPELRRSCGPTAPQSSTSCWYSAGQCRSKTTVASSSKPSVPRFWMGKASGQPGRPPVPPAEKHSDRGHQQRTHEEGIREGGNGDGKPALASFSRVATNGKDRKSS